MLDERSKAGRKQEPATGNEHLLVGMKISIPVLPSEGSYTSKDARSCVNDDCFDLLTFAKSQNSVRKKSPILEILHLRLLKLLHCMKNWWHKQVEACRRQIFWASAYVKDGDKGVYLLPNLVSRYIFSSSSFCRPFFKMAAANARHRCGAVNLRSKQSRFYLYLCVKLFVMQSGKTRHMLQKAILQK